MELWSGISPKEASYKGSHIRGMVLWSSVSPKEAYYKGLYNYINNDQAWNLPIQLLSNNDFFIQSNTTFITTSFILIIHTSYQVFM